MIKTLPLFASVAMVTLSGGSALGLTLVGSEPEMLNGTFELCQNRHKNPING